MVKGQVAEFSEEEVKRVLKEREDSIRKMTMWMLWKRGGSKLCALY